VCSGRATSPKSSIGEGKTHSRMDVLYAGETGDDIIMVNECMLEHERHPASVALRMNKSSSVCLLKSKSEVVGLYLPELLKAAAAPPPPGKLRGTLCQQPVPAVH